MSRIFHGARLALMPHVQTGVEAPGVREPMASVDCFAGNGDRFDPTDMPTAPASTSGPASITARDVITDIAVSEQPIDARAVPAGAMLGAAPFVMADILPEPIQISLVAGLGAAALYSMYYKMKNRVQEYRIFKALKKLSVSKPTPVEAKRFAHLAIHQLGLLEEAKVLFERVISYAGREDRSVIVAKLGNRLTSRNYHVHSAAKRALDLVISNSEPEDNREHLRIIERYFDDKSAKVRLAAVQIYSSAIERLNIEDRLECVMRLEGCLQDRDRVVRRFAVGGVGAAIEHLKPEWRYARVQHIDASLYDGSEIVSGDAFHALKDVFQHLNSDELFTCAVEHLSQLCDEHQEYLIHNGAIQLLEEIIPRLKPADCLNVALELETMLPNQCTQDYSLQQWGAAHLLGVSIPHLPPEERLARVERLEDLLEDDGLGGRVVRALGEAVPYLKEKDRGVRVELIEAYVKNPRRRDEAIWALGKVIPHVKPLERSRLVSHIAAYLHDDDRYVRFGAMDSLAKAIPHIRPEERSAYIRKIAGGLDDELEFVRYTAEKFLAEEFDRNGLAYTPYLAKQLISSTDEALPFVRWRTIIDSFSQGKFDASSEFHRNLEYTRFRRIVDHEKVKRHLKNHFSFEQYLAIFDQSQSDSPRPLSREDRFEIECAAHEAKLLEDFVLQVKEQADKLGRPVVVVPNLSYGYFPVAPMAGRLERLGIEVAVGMKVGSTESHENKEVVNSRLFKGMRTQILSKQPIVIVVDGTQHLMTRGSGGKDARYPDAYQGYLNQMIAMNDALGFVDVGYARAGKTVDDLARLRASEDFQSLVRVCREIIAKRGISRTEPYTFGMWNTAEKSLIIRGERKSLAAVPPLDPEGIAGSSMVFVNVGVLDEQIPAAIKQRYPDLEHVPAYFDDSGRIIDFDFGYDEYGVRYLNRLETELRKAYGVQAYTSVSAFIRNLRGSRFPTSSTPIEEGAV